MRNTSLLNLWGWGRGFLFHRWLEAARHRTRLHELLHDSPRLKNTCVRQVVSDKWFPLIDDLTINQQPKTYPHPPIPAARLVFVFLFVSVFFHLGSS